MKYVENNGEEVGGNQNLPNGDNVGQGTHDDRNSYHFEQPSFSKHTPGGFDSNT